MSSAQLDIHPEDELDTQPAHGRSSMQMSHPDLMQEERELLGSSAGSELKQQAAERLAAHRARRGYVAAAAAPQASTSSPMRSRTAHIAAAVAERYAHSQSYRAFLASEAERAVHQAQAAAQIATINAQAIAVAQQQLLADLESWESVPEQPRGPVAVPHVPLTPIDYAALFHCEPETAAMRDRDDAIPVFVEATQSAIPMSYAPSSFTVRAYDDATHTTTVSQHARAAAESRIGVTAHDSAMDEGERMALEEEIAFRHNPVFEEICQPEPTAANLLEFPRQLVAPRKARPRLAEGPLRDDEGSANAGQLRIFEVESDQISTLLASDLMVPEWSSILLSARPSADFTEAEDAPFHLGHVPQAAPVSLRLMAAAVDACLIVTVQAAFTAVFVLALTHLSGEQAMLEIPRSMALAGTTATLAVLGLLYQLLFFTLSDGTPGMRYARIGLCTFTDENPTRSAMRRRILSMLLAAFPLGLGLLWAFLDEDTLGWHDRMSRMYQRAY